MNQKKTKLYAGIAILVIIILIIVCVIVFQKKRGDTNAAKSVESKTCAASNENRPLVGTGNSSTNDIIMNPLLETIRQKLFSVNILEIQVNPDIRTEEAYDKFIEAFKTFTRAPTQEELRSLLRYKKFIDSPEVYSMGSSKEVEQMYVIMLNIVANKIEGDIVEIGTWKGGMGMWMKAMMNHFKSDSNIKDVHDRTLWLFDTFESFPEPTPTMMLDSTTIKPNPQDVKAHAITRVMYDNHPIVQEVKRNFEKYGLLDEKVQLVKGLFSDTIPAARRSGHLDKISVLRLDCDYYTNIYHTLEHLYFRIVKGGYVIIDDYNNPSLGCKQAVSDFREKYGIETFIEDRYKGSVYWQV